MSSLSSADGYVSASDHVYRFEEDLDKKLEVKYQESLKQQTRVRWFKRAAYVAIVVVTVIIFVAVILL